MSTSNEEQPYNKWEFKWDKKKVLALVITILVVTSMICYVNYKTSMRTTEVRAQSVFVIAGWDYPDEYGQGIYGYFFLENSSGVWLTVGGPIIDASNSSTYEFDVGISIGLDVRVTVNYTFLGLDAPDPYNYTAEEQPALNYLRLNVTVTSINGTVFAQQNFTYDELGGEIGGGVWYYSELVYFDFLNTMGEVYIVTVTYEIYGVWV